MNNKILGAALAVLSMITIPLTNNDLTIAVFCVPVGIALAVMGERSEW